MSSQPSSSHWRRSAQRFASQRFAMGALIFLGVVIIMAILAPLVSRYDPLFQELETKHSGPSWDHWLGTDNLGRDSYARLIYGARTSMLITISVTVFATIIAVPIGLISGYFSGKVDVIVMRLTDALMSIPPLVLALAIAGILGPGNRNMVIALVVVIVPGLVRLVRGQTLAVREDGFVTASKAIGTPSRVILIRRVFPHVLSPLLVQVALALGTILVVEASLSFLGLGDPLPNASWGSMLRQGFDLMATDRRLMLIPGIVIALATLAFNAVGDGLRDALAGGGLHKRRAGDVLGITSMRSSSDVIVGRPTTDVDTATDGDGETAGATTIAAGTTTDRDVAVESVVSRDELAPAGESLLEIRSLSLGFQSANGLVQVLDGVDLDVRRGEILGLVGESGCGKTVTAQSILRLVPSPPGRILAGSIRFEGNDLLRMQAGQLRQIRGREIAMIFQDPMASLNPAFTIGNQIVEAQRLHRDISKRAARTRAAELLDRVGIPAARHRLDDYPHTFSGGMRQRALIAMALANDPKLLIADEPTTALDVTVQAQILELIHELRDEFGMSVLFVTHDFGVVQELCDRVAVMYAGQVVERTSVDQMFSAPGHPYSAALLRSRPRLGQQVDRLPAIPGVVPSPADMPAGCRFQSRCDFAVEACSTTTVPLDEVERQHFVRCIRYGEIADSPDDRETPMEVTSP